MYQYEQEKPAIFTDEGQRDFLKVRDQVFKMLTYSGAVRMDRAMSGLTCTGSSWLHMAYVDRLVELDDIKEITSGDVPGQYRIFVAV